MTTYDALAHASIKNNLTEQQNLDKWKDSSILSKYASMSSTDAKNKLNTVLSNTTIKRACCLGSQRPNNTPVDYYTVPVKIPVPKNFSAQDGLSEMNEKYKFIKFTKR
jgi:hypothetical protein